MVLNAMVLHNENIRSTRSLLPRRQATGIEMDTPESYGTTSSSGSHEPTSRRSLRSTARAIRAMQLLAQSSGLEGQDQQQRVMDTSFREANQPTPVPSSLTSYSNVKKLQNEIAANLRKLQKEVLGDDWDQKLVSTTGERIAKPIPADDPPPQGLFNKYRKGLAIFYPPMPWGMPEDQMRGYHATPGLVIWDQITAIACVWVAISLPYAIFVDGVKDPEHRWLSNCPAEEFTSPKMNVKYLFAAIDLACDLAFVLDMILVFLSAKWVVTNYGREEWVLISDLNLLRWNYMFCTRQFWVDLLGIIPWQYVDCISTRDDSTMRIFRLIRLIKLTRLSRLYRLVEDLRYRFPASKLLFSVGKMLCLIGLLGHWFGCVWFCVGYVETGWVVRHGLAKLITHDEFDAHNNSVGTRTSLFPISEDPEYVSKSFYTHLNGRGQEMTTAIYWAFTTLVTLGYGDITALTWQEKCVAIVVMIVGCATFAWSTATVTSIMCHQPISVVRFQKTMDMLDEFISARGLTKEISLRLHEFCMLKYPNQRKYDEEGVLESLPVGIRRAVKMELFSDVIRKCPLFYGMEVSLNSDGSLSWQYDLRKSIAGDICMCMETLFKIQGLVLTTAGEVPDALYIVRSGRLSIQFEGFEIAKARAGDVAGEMALFGLSPNGRRLRSAVCQTMCELCMITVDNLKKLMKHDAFRVPLRRMLCVYLDGLVGSILNPQQAGKAQSGEGVGRAGAGGGDVKKDYASNYIPWMEIKDHLVRIDHYKDDNVRHHFIRSCNRVMAAGVKSHVLEIVKETKKKILQTDLIICLREFKTSDQTIEGRRRIVVACSWSSHDPRKIFSRTYRFCARSFTTPINVLFSKGRGHIMSSSNVNGGVLDMRLFHEAGVDWNKMGDVRFYVYEIIGNYCQPLPEDALSRLDNDQCSSPELSATEEMLLGLSLLYQGRMPLSTLIENRMKFVGNPYTGLKHKPLITPCVLSLETCENALKGDNVIKGFKKVSGPKSGAFSPRIAAVSEIEIDTECTRILAEDSRWYRIVARLRTHSTDDNHFWKETNRARVQKVRRSLCELLNMPEVLDQQYEPHLVDSNVVNTLRLEKMEHDITTMNKSWNTNLLALHSKLDKLLAANVKGSPP